MRISDWSSDVCSSDLTSIISHRKKNRNRSSVRNTPTTPPRFHSRLRWKKPTLRSISRHEQATAITPSRLVSTTSSKDRPSSPRRSEEHTSELQSLMRISYAVFCLKKKRTTNTTTTPLHLQHK